VLEVQEYFKKNLLGNPGIMVADSSLYCEKFLLNKNINNDKNKMSDSAFRQIRQSFSHPQNVIHLTPINVPEVFIDLYIEPTVDETLDVTVVVQGKTYNVNCNYHSNEIYGTSETHQLLIKFLGQGHRIDCSLTEKIDGSYINVVSCTMQPANCLCM